MVHFTKRRPSTVGVVVVAGTLKMWSGFIFAAGTGTAFIFLFVFFPENTRERERTMSATISPSPFGSFGSFGWFVFFVYLLGRITSSNDEISPLFNFSIFRRMDEFQ